MWELRYLCRDKNKSLVKPQCERQHNFSIKKKKKEKKKTAVAKDKWKEKKNEDVEKGIFHTRQRN